MSSSQVQSAWMARDMGPVRHLMTPEMYEQMHKECDRLRMERRINRLENIAVRSTEVTEAWQESGQDFVTVRFLASLLDYTVEESSNQLLAGSRTEPVKFEEYWTFTRPVGPMPGNSVPSNRPLGALAGGKGGRVITRPPLLQLRLNGGLWRLQGLPQLSPFQFLAIALQWIDGTELIAETDGSIRITLG